MRLVNLNTHFSVWKLAAKAKGRGGDYSREHHALLVKFKGGGLNIRGVVIRRTTAADPENSEMSGQDT